MAALYAARTGESALNKTRAAKLLGVSVDTFDRHVAGELPTIRRGSLRLYPVAELFRWQLRAATLAA